MRDFSASGSGGQAKAGIGFDSRAAEDGWAEAGCVTGDFQFVGAVTTMTRSIRRRQSLVQNRFRLGSGVTDYLKDQRRLDNGYAAGSRRRPLPSIAAGGDDCRMTIAFSSLRRPPSKASLASGAVEAGIWMEHSDECAHDWNRRLAGLHHLAAKLVGLDDLCAEVAQESGDGALAAAQAAGESYS